MATATMVDSISIIMFPFMMFFMTGTATAAVDGPRQPRLRNAVGRHWVKEVVAGRRGALSEAGTQHDGGAARHRQVLLVRRPTQMHRSRHGVVLTQASRRRGAFSNEGSSVITWRTVHRLLGVPPPQLLDA